MPSDEILKTIARAGTMAPSGMNRQNWQIIVAKNKGLIDDLDSAGMEFMSTLPDKTMYNHMKKRGGRLFYGAPCMIFIAVKEAFPKGAELVDLGIVAQNISLAATALGIDNCHCGFAAFPFAGARAQEFKERLKFPPNYECGIAVLLGYAKTSGKPHEPNDGKITVIE
jgi:nitroreductase